MEIKDDFWRDDLDGREVMVTIRCITYNHEAYIRDALEGFVNQKTNFRFEAIIHDDASTDGTTAIIREYAEKYPSVIKPIFETENQFSKHDGSLGKIMENHTRGKYIAMCEGDDYWTDPLKLQKQVDFMESHPDYSMCWSNAVEESSNGVCKEYNRYSGSCETPLEDIIMKGGLWIPTASIFCRKCVTDNWPPEDVVFHIGDYPLQVHAADMGKVFYFKDVMVCYRYQSAGSWTSKVFENRERRLKWFVNEIEMIDNLIRYTDQHCHYYLRQVKYLRQHYLKRFENRFLGAAYTYFRISKKYRPQYAFLPFLRSKLKKYK